MYKEINEVVYSKGIKHKNFQISLSPVEEASFSLAESILVFIVYTDARLTNGKWANTTELNSVEPIR